MGYFRTKIQGIYCFSFRDELAEIDGKEILLRKVKSPKSNRSVPVHSQLLEWGILDHWERTIADRQRTYIFNNRKPGMKDSTSNDLSDKITRALQELGIHEKNVIVAYSLRHRFINRISQLGLNVHQVGYFAGHVDQDDEEALSSTTATHYLKDDNIRGMQEVIETLPKIDF